MPSAERPRSPPARASPPEQPISLFDFASNAKVRNMVKQRVEREILKSIPDVEVLYIENLRSHDDEIERVKGRERIYVSTSVFCLEVTHEPRRTAILIVESRIFDPLILITILANCITMAWQSPLDPEGTWKSGFINACEPIFLAVFTVELVLKVIAYGFLMHKGAYLRDAWCQLDFIVVTLAWLPIIFPAMGNYSVLRAFRALRPLRALKRLPGMPLLVQWILNVLPKMGNVLALFLFVFLVFGIIGMELFKGSLHYRCALPGFDDAGHATQHPVGGADAPADPQEPFDTGLACGPGDHAFCEQQVAGSVCRFFDANPDHGWTSFDSMGFVFVALLQSTTFDEWSTAMYALQASFSPYVWIYFVLISLIAGYFVANLFLAVIFLEFDESTKSLEADGPASLSERSDSPYSPLDDDTAGPLEADAMHSQSPTATTPHASDVEMPSTLHRSGAGGGSAEGATGGGCLERAATSSLLNHASTLLVLMNMVLMCMPYEGMPDDYAAQLESGATVITWIFIAEMVLKVLGIGCSKYWSDGWNVLDGSIVLMSIMEMAFTYIFQGRGYNLSFLRMLRILRVLRILRLMRSWRGLYKIISTFVRAIPQMSNIFILILLCMFMFALLGMQLLGGIFTVENGFSPLPCPGEICADGLREKPRFHFDYCMPAMITIFILLTGEWVDLMHPVTDLVGAQACIFFIVVVLIGKFLLMNLLVAVILNEFQDDSDSPATSPNSARSRSPDTARLLSNGGLDTYRNLESSPGASGQHDQRPPLAAAPKGAWPHDYSFCCFGPNSAVRQICRRICRHPAFDPIVIAAIIFSSVCLALDSPRLDVTSDLYLTLRQLDYAFTSLFVVEMLIKSIAMGFMFGDGAYLKSPWNQLDCTIVITSVVVLLAEAIPSLRSLRVLRVVRVLRPLRLVSRNEGMKLIITSLFKALPAVSNVFGVVLSLQLVFVIIGMQLFSGTMASCVGDPAILTRSECHQHLSPSPPSPLASVTDDLNPAARQLKGGSRPLNVDLATHWANPTIGSFDNFGEAMRLLYVMSTGDEWETPMYLMMGTTEAGQAPARNDFSPYALFPVSWMFLGYVFAINLFVGVVVDNFSRMQKEMNGSASMTYQQQQWAATMRNVMKTLPTRTMPAPHNAVRRLFYEIVNSNVFDGLITTVIIANVLVMGCNYYGIENDALIFTAFNNVMDTFSYIYYAECIMKLLSFGIDGYFGDGWCRFDFFLVCSTLVDQFATELLAKYLPMPPMLLRVMRIFRIMRILRLLRHAKSLRDLIVTMILSFPSLFNVGSILALITFMYAVLGRQLFTFLAHGGPSGSVNGGINGDRNFETFGSSFLLLFQCLTGDGWSAMMADAMLDEASGICTEEAGDCGSYLAIPYFVSFLVIGGFVFVNLIVAVILDNFATLHNQDPDLVSATDLELFLDIWSEFDPDASNHIGVRELPNFLLKVPRPLGLKGSSEMRAKQLCMRLELDVTGGRVQFTELLQELIHNNYFRSGQQFDEEDFKALVPELKMPTRQPTPPLDTPPSQRSTPDDQHRAAVLFAISTLLQPAVRGTLYAMRDRARGRLAAKAAARDKKGARPATGSRRPAGKAKEGTGPRSGTARSRTPPPPTLSLEEMPPNSTLSSPSDAVSGLSTANGMAARQKLREKGKGDNQPYQASTDRPLIATEAASRAARPKQPASDRASAKPTRHPRSAVQGRPGSPSSIQAPGSVPLGKPSSAPVIDAHLSTAPGSASQMAPVSQIALHAQAPAFETTGVQTGGGWFGFGGGGGGGGSDSCNGHSDAGGGWFGLGRSEPERSSAPISSQAVQSNDAPADMIANYSTAGPPQITPQGGMAALHDDPGLLRPKARGASPNRACTGTGTASAPQRKASSDRPAARGPGRGNSYSSHYRSPQSPQAKVRPGPSSTRTGNATRVHAPPTREMEVSETPRGIAVLEWQQQRAGSERAPSNRQLNRSPTLKTWDYHPAGEPEGMERRERAIMRLTS